MIEWQHKMAKAICLSNLQDILAAYFAKEGIHSFAVTYYNQHTKTGNKLLYDWVSHALKPWHDYYLEEGFADIDRTLETAERSLLPVFWDVHEQLLAAKNKRERRIREESIRYGHDKGLSITIFGPQGDFIVCALHQRLNEQGLNNWTGAIKTAVNTFKP